MTDDRDTVWISASQIKDYRTCPRKWWFKKVQKIPEPRKDHFAIGTCLHSVVERWLKGEEDLYPEGWETNENGTVSPRDQAMIRDRVQSAIDAGMIFRSEEMEVEPKVELDVIPGVKLVGYIDVRLPREIHDHKTPRRTGYLETEKTIGKDPQLLIYAKALGDDVDSVRVRHNYYIKEPEDWDPDILAVEGTATRKDIDEHWEQVKVDAAEIKQIREQNLPVEDWPQVEGPREKGACRKYGGCPYAAVCGGVERNLVRFREQAEEAAGVSHKNRETLGQPPQDAVDIHIEAKTTHETMRNVINENAVASGALRAPRGQAKTPAVEAVEPAPWAKQGCSSCGNTKHQGYRANGQPCPMCVMFVNAAKSRGEDVPMPRDYDIHVAEGMVTAVPKGAPAPVQEAAPEPEEPVFLEDVIEQEPDLPSDEEMNQDTLDSWERPEGEPPPDFAPAVEQIRESITEQKQMTSERSKPARVAADQAAEDIEKPEPKRGRKPKTFTLYINCRPETPPSGTLDLSQILREFDESFREATGKNPHLVDQFQKRDLLKNYLVKAYAEHKGHIIARATTAEEREAASIFRQYASTVIAGEAC